MDEQLETEAFFNGVATGIKLYEQKLITAVKRKEPLKIGEELYFLQSGRERLEDMFDKICK